VPIVETAKLQLELKAHKDANSSDLVIPQPQTPRKTLTALSSTPVGIYLCCLPSPKNQHKKRRKEENGTPTPSSQCPVAECILLLVIY